METFAKLVSDRLKDSQLLGQAADEIKTEAGRIFQSSAKKSSTVRKKVQRRL
jgi:hypothetical protein